MPTAWRVVRSKHAESAMTGEGARLYGGRFNSEGTAMVYAADSLALAVLEISVHLPSYRLLRDLVYLRIEIPEALVLDVEALELPDDWRSTPLSRTSQVWGDRWVADGARTVARVPSVLIPESWNYLINPRHPDVEEVRVGEAKALGLDPRV